ncbi:uridine kinase family protein [Virgibacillus ndiopensis]|uniref:uridine kinase family protein n=1 Tax=Virgibacillus ndiopensis TaxID=2004408 RepID=UPI001C3F2601|nr:hypothetical protein [Virgibacillus ndiopensis]
MEIGLKQKIGLVRYLPIVEAVERLLMKGEPALIAVDGRCGSGKSTLAAFLAKVFDCNVFHMDDFFLPFEMKTRERMAQPGGNIHYERFREEVLIPLQSRETVSYRPYDCTIQSLTEPIFVELKKLAIVEGVYAMHPILQQDYDYSIFLTVDSQVQEERILKRNGEAMYQRFVNQWIPLEEDYFSELNIKSKCDLVFDTTLLWE